MYSLHEVFETSKLFPKDHSPIPIIQRIFHKVAQLDVAIHTHIVEHILQVLLLLCRQVGILDKGSIHLNTHCLPQKNRG